MVIEPTDPFSAEAVALLAAYLAEIQDTFGYDDTRAAPTQPEELVPPYGVFLVVRGEDGIARGCGALRMLDTSTAEVKRMWLHPALRRRGAGRALLDALEAHAARLGAVRGVLDTNASLTNALALYRSAGWLEVAAYNDNAEATHWFAKDLTAPAL